MLFLNPDLRVANYAD